MSLMTKVFGTYSQRQVKKILPLVDKIEALADKYAAMDDATLSAQTGVLKDRLSKGETLDDILPDAFAAVREASTRVLGKRHYRVQLIGGIIIHQGRIAEMKTGEGKTLVATLPAYLNALNGKGVHIVTVNDYLAKRDSEWMGSIFRFMGLSVGLIVNGLKTAERQAAYNADITYGTNNELGFDYLRDNMAVYKERTVQRGHAFAIVDEVDSILVDEARTPLIISGAGEQSDPLYEKADAFVRTLKVKRIKEIDAKEDQENTGYDYIVDEKARTAVLTGDGLRKAEKHFGVENIGDVENMSLMHYLNNAIRARGVMQKDVDYLVRDGAVLIIDSFTGRVMHGRRYSNGLHQAIEAKEGVKIERENKTMATITFQNYFRLYGKLSGMTGTALTEEDEFREIYMLDVVEIPTNKPVIRIDGNDAVYSTLEGKYRAIIKQIEECHAKGQPVLVGTVSVEKSEYLSKLLARTGVPHTVLNAKHHEKEAEIVAQAGKLGAVTISTNMAGRGTDIVLGGNADYMAKERLRKEGYDEAKIFEATGFATTEDDEIIEIRDKYALYTAEAEKTTKEEAEKVRAAGGLYILGTERHESRRIDNQLRGRAGRQGDPGESKFFLSLQDDLMRLFGAERVLNMVQKLGLDEDTPIDARILSGSIESAQKRLEGNNFERRKRVLEYDDVMNQHRSDIYSKRREVLDGKDLKDNIQDMFGPFVDSYFDKHADDENGGALQVDALKQELGVFLGAEDGFKDDMSEEELRDMLIERVKERYTQQEELFTPEIFREVERVILLESIDRNWMLHIDNMDDLKEGIGLLSYAQKNPIVEYRIEGNHMREMMLEDVYRDTVRKLLMVRPRVQTTERKEVLKGDTVTNGEKPIVKRTVIKKKEEKVGPNDLCPCGSGLKYKKCCMGKNDEK